ncbi:interactor of constitutive active ROPs 2, chloroplastic [Gossypium hirsutum]|uniref:Interactor of constitutive active ROPs 2, chloroplastic n=1 Tax=Gossypium hirsutum TaxID=3635 RepID=A0ABM2YQM5_GOSHI|nr:interactor of constitutive active ROPs 2, chloroplastic [Gossypium hirsutum]
MDSDALVSAMNEIQKLKVQLEKVYKSESTQMKHTESAHANIQNMKIELTKTLFLVEKIKSKLTDCEESEAQGLELVSKTRMQLEVANKMIENLYSDATKETEAYNMLLLELEQSKELSQKEAKLRAELTRTKANVKELRQKNKGLRESKLAAKLKKLEFDLKKLKDNLIVNETELKTMTKQNKMLKREIESKMKSDESVVVSLEASKVVEQATLIRVRYLTKKIDKFNRGAARLTEELESAQAANTSMEAELKRLKVQANRWREAATAMLSNNGKYSDKTIPFDITIRSPKWESIDGDDDDGDYLSKEKNNMLRKIGVL